jgi:SulP family sulfate permease
MLRRLLPIVEWLPRYQRSDLRADLVAGVTVAALMIPQSMAYVQVAGFPPVIGLYASVVPLYVYALLGRSRVLAIGPVASMTLITATGIAGVTAAGSASYVELAATMALMTGVLALVLGLARLGFLMSFLSDPVLTGFVGGLGVVILVTQIELMCGLEVATSTQVVGEIPRFFRELGDVSVPDLAFGLATIALLLATRRWRLFPSALVATVGGIVVVWAFDLANDVAVVGVVDGGLAMPALPTLELDVLGALAPTAVAVTIIGFIETMALDKTVGQARGPRLDRPRLDPNDELRAYGGVNVAAGFFQALPVLGVPTRTAVAARAGARTQLTGVIAATVALLVVQFATGVFRYLPVSVLAGVVTVAGLSFFKVAKAKSIWATKRADFWLGIITFAATPVLGVEWGIVIGGVLSLAVVVFRAAHPHLTVLGRVPGTDDFRDLARHEGLETHDGVVLVRVDGPLFYANADYVTNRVEAIRRSSSPAVHALVLDLGGVDDVDSTAATAVDALVRALHESQVDVYFTNVDDDAFEVLQRAGIVDLVGADRILPTDDDAVVTLEGLQAHGRSEPAERSADDAGPTAR